MVFQNCVACGRKSEGLVKLLPHFKSSRDYEYIHKKCLLFYKSDWNNRLAVNEKLFYKEYLQHCSICGKKNYKQVIHCSQSLCQKSFHFDCVDNPIISKTEENGHRPPQLLIFCSYHDSIQNVVTDLDEAVNSLYNSYLVQKEQQEEPHSHHRSKHKKKHKKKHSHKRSRSHRKKSRRSSKNLKFSDGEESESKKSISEIIKPMQTKKSLLVIQKNIITNDLVSQAYQKKLQSQPQIEIESKTPQTLNYEIQHQNHQQQQQIKPQILSQIQQPIQQQIQIEIQKNTIIKQQIFPQITKISVEDPEFPRQERETKRDQSIAKWWDKINEVFFIGEKKMPLTQQEDFENLFQWHEQPQDQELLDISDASNFEPIIQLKYLYRDSMNVVFRTSQSSYQYTNYSYDIISLIKLVERIPKDRSQQIQDFIDIHQKVSLFKEIRKFLKMKYQYKFAKKEPVGKSLIFHESCELSQEDFDQCLILEDKIKSYYQLLELQLDIENETVEQLDIVYHALKEDLNEVVQENNQMRENINNQIVTTKDQQTMKTLKKKQQMIMDLLKWSQIVKAFINGYKDKQKDVLNTFYPCLNLDSQSSQKAQLKKKKIHSKENSKPLDTDCKICFDYHYTDFNPVIYCGRCSTSFHKICYCFIGNLDEQDVLCDACLFEQNKSGTTKRNPAKCRICKKLGLPQKQIDNQFYHVSCLLLTNLVIIKKGVYKVRNSKNDIKQICKDNETSTPQCAICGDDKGFRFTCFGNETIPCRHAFHPLCAYLHGLTINIESEDIEQCFEEQKFGQLNVRIKCVLHCGKDLQDLLLQTYYRRFALNYESAAQCGGQDVFLEQFKTTKGYKYLYSKQPITKNDTLQQQINNQNGTTTLM
ncbi:unnamed protein product [Paramecium octaurelia]|uniref:Zinc finger PHD-type domain-containing protein n=1 Tax=Paramecium octaurelia TaxID=43137 RepID=A0A8S1U3N5_PAROT|nr:unnamed protein product [Paramecium octaurelia]